MLFRSEHVVGASIGVAQYPADARTPQELLRCADVALYAAKARGRGCAVVFDRALDEGSLGRIQLLADLRTAVAAGELRLHYQPRVDPASAEITSAEALVRWQHPRRGLLSPDTFIALAEESGLIGEIGQWVLDEACAQLARWRSDGLRLDRLSVNVSPRQLASGDLPTRVLKALAAWDLPAELLELEVTESVLIGDTALVVAQLTQLRQHGVSIAMDDFGTGYSSMAVLTKMPIDVMKVDRSFVTDILTDRAALAVVQAIVSMAKSLGLRLVAEGVEERGQADALQAMGCDELQGYFFSRPLPADRFQERLRVPQACA